MTLPNFRIYSQRPYSNMKMDYHINPEDELYLKLKYNIETFDQDHFVYFKFTEDLNDYFSKRRMNLCITTGGTEEISLGVFVDNIVLYPQLYREFLWLLLEFDKKNEHKEE